MSFPATLAQDILQKGLETPEIVDEIYLQICKHLTANPRPESCQRGWQIMCMCVGTFPPSRDFEDYLLNFILQHTCVEWLLFTAEWHAWLVFIGRPCPVSLLCVVAAW